MQTERIASCNISSQEKGQTTQSQQYRGRTRRNDGMSQGLEDNPEKDLKIRNKAKQGEKFCNMVCGMNLQYG